MKNKITALTKLKKLILKCACFACSLSLVFVAACSSDGTSGGQNNQGGLKPPFDGGQGGNENQGGQGGDSSVTEPSVTDDNEVTEITIDGETHSFSLLSSEGGTITYGCKTCDKTATLTLACVSGDENSYSVSGTTLTFENLTQETAYSLSGEFYGNIVINAATTINEVKTEYKFELELNGVKISSYNAPAIYVESGDKITVSAKKGTDNYIIDYREAVSEEDISAAVYTKCDLNLQGKGNLYVKSVNNNGIHSKGDLKVKNAFIQVDCKDNALKGNDSVTIESGTLVLIARAGDGIKTSNSDLSSKGKQRGTVSILGGDILIYSSRDGIDSAYNVEISQTSSLNLKIYTDKYSKYSEESASNSSSSTSSGGSSSSASSGRGGFGGGLPGGPGGQGGNGGQGGMQDGNDDKGDYSTKGVKADNEIIVSGGTIAIYSYDDAIHANSDNALENGETALGNVSVTGGALTLYSCDDAVHADGTVVVNGGDINVLYCYEGLEGAFVSVLGGNVSIISTDDGINGTSQSGAAITISGGTIYVYAGGDGVDSNSTDSYGGILFSGGKSVIISSGRSDSAIDTERGYKYEGGYVLAIGVSGGMSGETTNCSPSVSSIGGSANLSLQSGVIVTAAGVASVKMPVAMNASVVVLGAKGASITSGSSLSEEADANGVLWLVE